MIHEFCESINDKCLTESIESPFDKVLIQFPSTDKFEYTWNTYYKRRKEIIDKKEIDYLRKFQNLFKYYNCIKFTLKLVAKDLGLKNEKTVKLKFNDIYYPYTYKMLMNHRINFINTTRELSKFNSLNFKKATVLPADNAKMLGIKYRIKNDFRIVDVFCENCNSFVEPIVINKINKIEIKCKKCKKVAQKIRSNY